MGETVSGPRHISSKGHSGPAASPYLADGRYAHFVLFVLLGVYSVAWMDRTILSILAEDVKRHFQLTDAQLGFLHGTAFGVFYALFGYPLGRLADQCRRVRLMSVCLVLWSAMTAFSGLAANVGQLVVARIGVGIGEAAAAPISYSLLSDWFSRTRRGMALGIYGAGLYLGQGLAFTAGAFVVVRWTETFGKVGPFGLEGWQAAFLILAIPGMALAVVVATLREPLRGLADGIERPSTPGLWSSFFDDVASVIPPFTLYQTARCGPRIFGHNILFAAFVILLSWALIHATGDVLQWLALGLVSYAIFSSAQILRTRDPAAHALTWRTPAFMCATLGFSLASMLTINLGFWTAPLALRSMALDKATVGTVLGLTTTIFGMLGVISGGRLADLMLRRSPAGRIHVGLASVIIPIPFVIGMCITRNPTVFFLLNVPVVFFGIMWLPAGAATIQELVMPRMRGTAAAILSLMSTFIGSAFGPYLVGKVSAAQGSLSIGILASLPASLAAFALLWIARRQVPEAESSKAARAGHAEDAGARVKSRPQI